MRYLIMLTIGLYCASASAGEVYYRYTNNHGSVAIDDTLPLEALKNGYEIVSSKGVVIKTVPPNLSEAEVKKMERQKAEADAIFKQREQDKILLQKYSSLNDITSLKESRLEAIKIDLNISEENFTRLIMHQNQVLYKAATLERNGEPVPTEVKRDIRKTKEEIERIKEHITSKQLEIIETERQFGEEIDRFQQLQQHLSN